MGKRDLITKDFALYVVHYFASMQTWSKNEILAEIDRTIKEAKEDVVRCKDCKHWASHRVAKYGRCMCVEEIAEGQWHTQAEDFCSHGERKEE